MSPDLYPGGAAPASATVVGPRAVEPLLRVTDLRVALRAGPRRPILREVSLTLRPGEIRALVGESGSGKTITALSIIGLLPRGMERVGGQVVLDGTVLTNLAETDLEKVRGRRVGMVFQDPLASLNPVLTVGVQVAEPIRAHLRLDRQATNSRVRLLLEQVGLPSDPRLLRRYPHELSGGMRQRVVIALALSCDPEVLLADEPTTALDVTVQARILELVRDIAVQRQLAVLFVTHALAVAAQLADSITVMYAGAVVESGPAVEVLARPTHPYTRGLLSSAPRLDVRTRPIAAMPGSVESTGSITNGCRFNPRCPAWIDRCRVDDPPLAAYPAGHEVACWVTPGERWR